MLEGSPMNGLYRLGKLKLVRTIDEEIIIRDVLSRPYLLSTVIA